MAVSVVKGHLVEKQQKVRGAFWEALQSQADAREIVAALERGESATLGGVAGSARSLLVALQLLRCPGPVLVVTSDQHAMEHWEDDLTFWFQWWPADEPDVPQLLTLPHLETLPYEDREPTVGIRRQRGLVRKFLLEHETTSSVIVAPVRSAMKRQVPGDFLLEHTLRVRPGEPLDRDGFAMRLVDDGYEFAELVVGPGQFSVRGGIMDVFPITVDQPVRIELFGDEVDSLRHFDVESQRSTGPAEQILILPANEQRLTRAACKAGVPLVTLLDLFGETGRVVVDRTEDVAAESERVGELVEKMFHQRNELLGEDSEVELVPPATLYLESNEVMAGLSRRANLLFSDFWTDARLGDLELGHARNLHMKPMEFHQPERDARLDALLLHVKDGRELLVSCDNTGQAERLADLLWTRLKEKGAPVPDGRKPAAPPGVHVVVGTLDEGFSWPGAGWAVATDRELFGRYRQFRPSRRGGIGVPIMSLLELSPGNHIVHVDHGVARYVGLKLLEVGGQRSEFLELRFADDDVLYVPIEQVERVGRYIGSEDAPPNLDKLGSKSWDRTKQKAQEAILEMAQELLEIYAERRMRKGHAFGGDEDWQREFESSFMYVETPDQLTSIQQVKADLEKEEPMDRLLCGDVGFGKTEVAMRAAFKVVMEGMQVAILVPTTLLAQQHTHTFRERMADYPVSIAQLSRLVSPKEQNRTIEALGAGEIDIVIGTHRLLSKDVHVQRLGLVIIDEEQRFGVRHKERLKEMRRMVDVLSLTATPIPRTLYMSLSGIRDMSIVNTPPRNRLPIETYVMDWSKSVIEGAILRELSRGGQVYFVHDRVESIAGIAHIVSEIVPDAKIAVAHGQMARTELEKVMDAFVARRYDILVCTTIIESGLDIPNCNTMVINRADHFGLAQLYQLRGRVGRDRHQAYCYLLVPSTKSLTPIARRRLCTIQEFNELGSGFKIAMRDLEIRGMGNILGRHQHGHIAAIGLDLYNKLLTETIDGLRGTRSPLDEMDVMVERERRGGIPPDYVISSKQRLGIFKRLASTRRLPQLDELREEMRDLYGPSPPEVEAMFETARLKILSRAAGIERLLITEKNNRAELRLGPPRLENFDPLEYIELDGHLPGQLTLSQKKGNLSLLYASKAELASEVEQLLLRLQLSGK